MYGIWDGTKVIAQFVTPMTVKSNRRKFQSDTLSLKRKTSRRTAQRWEIETNLEPLTRTANELFVQMIDSDTDQPFDIIVPQNMGSIMRRTSTAACSATGAQGANNVDVTGHNGLIPMGTFVKFSGHDKVYATKTDLDVGGTNVLIIPDLIADVSAETMTYLDDVVMRCLYDFDTIVGMVYVDGILQDNGQIRMVEKL